MKRRNLDTRKQRNKRTSKELVSPEAPRILTLDLSDTPEFLAVFGIEPRLYEGSKTIKISFGPRDTLEERGHWIVETPDRRAALTLFGLRQPEEPVRRPRPRVAAKREQRARARAVRR